MQLHYDEETEAFRSELRGWLGSNLPPMEDRSEPVLSSAYIPEWARSWQRLLFDNGWLVPGWPPELGGRNASALQQMVYFEELARLEVPRTTNPQGLSIVTPSILDWGNPAQKERFALATLKAEISWCIGMSEPGAGSDLAGLRTRADLQGDRFVVNGQKVWTSGAHHADWCLCFVRTDPEAPKHQGISVLIVDMRSEGIETRPLPELTDRFHADFNEVFFTDVEVPAENLLGELNRGWSIAGGSLAHERGMLWIREAAGIETLLDRVVAVAAHPPEGVPEIGKDPLVADMIADAYVRAQALKLLGYRGFSKSVKGLEAPEHSVLKLMGSELRRRITRDVAEALGPAGTDVSLHLAPSFGSREEDAWIVHYLQSFAGTIAGGTSEIQRNIIAERVLGLPRR